MITIKHLFIIGFTAVFATSLPCLTSCPEKESIFSLLNRRRYSDVLVLLRNNPDALTTTSIFGNSPLHMAGKLSLEFLQQLYVKHPLECREAVSLKNKQGNRPIDNLTKQSSKWLLLASWSNEKNVNSLMQSLDNSEGVKRAIEIRKILDLHHRMENNNWQTVFKILSIDPSIICFTTINGDNMLHLVAKSPYQSKKLTELYSKHPAEFKIALTLRNKQNRTPLEQAKSGTPTTANVELFQSIEKQVAEQSQAAAKAESQRAADNLLYLATIFS